MSYDIFLQGFHRGDGADRDGDRARRMLLGVATKVDMEHEYMEVGYEAGTTDVYGVPRAGDNLSSLMFNHCAGLGIFALMIELARTLDLVVFAPGAPACVVSRAQYEHLPAELRHDVVEVHTAEELQNRLMQSDSWGGGSI